MTEAHLYNRGKDKSVDCYLCRHRCHIKEGASGICKVRENREGMLVSIFYGQPCALSVDPIEKKPLFHFYPGSESLSIATLGCNFQCPFCQNWNISQYGRDKTESAGSYSVSPKEVVEHAIKNNCKTIAYTYSEPTIFYEYAKDISKIAKENGIKNIFVTNGFMTREMLDDMHPLLGAANVDLKTFSEKTYKQIIKGDLKGVLDSIEYMKHLGVWLEITTLIIPGMNDSTEEITSIAKFIAGVDPSIPWHISRFYPHYKTSDNQPTSIEKLSGAYEIGKSEGLHYIYLGNVPGDAHENTLCFKCNELLIERSGFTVKKINLVNGKCPKCNEKVSGVF
jgi:pyruvate formate lyase activating enzyme